MRATIREPLWLVCGFAALAVACRKSPTVDPRAIDPYREQVHGRLAALADVGRQLPALRIASPAVAFPLDGVRFGTDDELAGRVTGGRSSGPMPDGIVLDASVFGPEHHANYDFQLGERNEFVQSAGRHAESRDGLPGTTEAAVRDCQQLAALRFVIVVRTTALALPDVDAARSLFRPGTFAGEALVFRLEGEHATFLGGFPIAATNSESVRVRWQQNREYQRREWLKTDLVYNTYVSLHSGLQARAPGVRLKPTDWYRSTL